MTKFDRMAYKMNGANRLGSPGKNLRLIRRMLDGRKPVIMQAEDLQMRALAIVTTVMAAAGLCANDKKIPRRSTENDLVEITANALADREAIRQSLGSDLGGHYILVEVRVSPKDGNNVKIDRVDFVLRT